MNLFLIPYGSRGLTCPASRFLRRVGGIQGLSDCSLEYLSNS